MGLSTISTFVKLQPDVWALSNPHGAMMPTVRWPPVCGSPAAPAASGLELQIAMAAVLATIARVDNPRFMGISVLSS